jgi:pimeloyl-ACP methyl ester carboxylesterase
LLAIFAFLLLKPSSSKLHDQVLQEYDLEDHQTQIDGLTVYYQTAGNPENQPFVALHGWGGKHEKTFENRARWIKKLADNGYFVIAPEHPGLARSQTPDRVWNNHDYGDYVYQFLQQLGVDKPIIHGQSFGGIIALTYATDYPEDLSQLVLTDSALPIYRTGGRYLRAIKPLGDLFFWIMQTRLAPQFLKRELMLSVLSVPIDFQSSETFTDRALMGKIMYGKNNQNIDFRVIQVSTLLFWGDKDWNTPGSIGKLLDREIPNSELTFFKGGHLILYDHLDEIIEKINHTPGV